MAKNNIFSSFSSAPAHSVCLSQLRIIESNRKQKPALPICKLNFIHSTISNLPPHKYEHTPPRV